MTKEMNSKVGIIMGSKSDLATMEGAAAMLKEFGIEFEMMEFAKAARASGFSVIIAGAGGAAHLPGMVASITTLPVIGVPIKSSNSIDGWDSVLSILQMPTGVPVATVALNGAKNAGILAAEIIGVHDENVATRLEEYKEALKAKVKEMNS